MPTFTHKPNLTQQPASADPRREASAHTGEVTKASTPVAPSVVEFMKAVQKESGLKVLAHHYPEHEKHGLCPGNTEEVGKYSFDVDLGGLIRLNAEGLYEGKRRIGLSGGGSAGPGREGSIHHAPAPYILHIHFNVMPIGLAGQYLAGKVAPPSIDLGHWQ
jgi:hypothetical protein